MSNSLKGRKIAFLVTDGFEQSELTKPWEEIQNAGAEVILVSPKEDKVQAVLHGDKTETFDVDLQIEDANASDFDGLVLPGGVLNPDALRTNKKAVSFVRDFFKQGKPVASICHGPAILIEAGVVEGRKLTSYPSIQTDLKNAGANWVDEEVVVDRGLVTSRSPDDLEAFCAKTIEEFREGKHKNQAA